MLKERILCMIFLMMTNLIREIVEMFKEDIDEVNAEEMDDSTEITMISASSALKSLENVCLFLLQQEDTGE